MRLPDHTRRRLKQMARRYGSQANAVVELVDERFGCPVCGNVDMDTLVWDEDEDTVSCAKCGHRYNPVEG